MEDLKLSKPQIELLRSAANRGGILWSFGTQHRTIEILLNAGMITRNFQLTLQERNERQAWVKDVVRKAGEVLPTDWRQAFSLLQQANNEQDIIDRQVWWITESARTLLSQV